MKDQQAKLTRQAQNARAKLEAARPRNPALDAVMRTVERDTASGGGVLAGAVAFRIFMFMVPFVFLLVGVFGLGSSASDQDPQDLARKAGITGIVAKAVSSVGDLSFTERIFYVVVVGFATFLATRALIKVLRIVHALVWHTRAGKLERPTRAALALIAIVLLAMGLAAMVGVLRGQSFLLGLIATLLYAAIPMVVWVYVSWHLPRPDDLPWTALIPGGVLFGLGLEGLHLVTVYWIAHSVESKTETYGAIGFALALLLWAYLIGRLITTAAVVNESLWTRNQERLAARRRTSGETRRGGPEGPPRTDERSAWED
ncbi:MAG: YhjD/YihY/BrkB family envelope integrity protein [Acidimicrobiia bacterium]